MSGDCSKRKIPNFIVNPLSKHQLYAGKVSLPGLACHITTPLRENHALERSDQEMSPFLSKGESTGSAMIASGQWS